MYVGWYVSVHGFSAYRCVRVLRPFARGMRGPPVFCPKGSRPVVQLAHGVWTPENPIDRGKKRKHNLATVKEGYRMHYEIRGCALLDGLDALAL